MQLGFTPTPFQAGHVMGGSVQILIEKFQGTLNKDWLEDAGISQEQYLAELFLLGAAAAMHAVESSGLSPEVEQGVAVGLYSWIRELPEHYRDLLLVDLESATDYYAEASETDAKAPVETGDSSDMDLAFGDRLLLRGENNERRGRACWNLSMILPSTLWTAHYKSACQVLHEAALVATQ